MFKNARGSKQQASEDDASAEVVSEDGSDSEEPLVVKRTPRLRSAKPEPDTTD